MPVIVFEGVNGTGHTTMANKLHADRPDSILTRHPGSTPLGQELRKLLKFGNFGTTPQQELLLFAADAMIFYQNIVEKNPDKLIICDRLNLVGALTYQLAGGAPFHQIKCMFRFLKDLGWKERVSKLLIFDAPFEIVKERLEKPNLIDQDKGTNGKKDQFESRGDNYMQKVADNYRMILRNGISMFDGLVDDIQLVDASKDQDTVYKQITNILAS